MSTKTGRAPQWRIALAVAMNEWLAVITSSPGPTPTASSARCSAVVQLLTAQAWSAPTKAANSCSKAATSGPCVTQPEQHGAPGRRGLGLAQHRLRDRDHDANAARRPRRARSRHHSTSSASPARNGISALKAELGRGGIGRRQPARHGVDRPLGVELGRQVRAGRTPRRAHGPDPGGCSRCRCRR